MILWPWAHGAMGAAMAFACQTAAAAQTIEVPAAQSETTSPETTSPDTALTGEGPSLPTVADRPLEQDGNDPLLALAETQGDGGAFLDAVSLAVSRHGNVRSASAMVDAADARRDEAGMGLIPDVQLGLQSRESIASSFSGQPGTQFERTRARSRVDATFQVRQTLLDFGTIGSTISAAGERLRAAREDLDAAREQVALSAIAAWYDVFAARALLSLSNSFVEEQEGLVADLEQRIQSGFSAEGDMARLRSSLALARTDRARYRRMLAGAVASYEEFIGTPPPPDLERAPAPAVPAVTAEMAAFLARQSPAVLSAEAQARAAADDARATSAERLPVIDGSIEGGRYGLVRDQYDGDYDIRAVLTLRQNFFTGAIPRARGAKAQARAADARADAIADEAARAAAIAWADVDSLDVELQALADNYVASRQTRDVLALRFLASRGELFDVMQAQDSFFAIAARYIQVLTERDAARYVLLARTGRLLGALGLPNEGEYSPS